MVTRLSAIAAKGAASVHPQRPLRAAPLHLRGVVAPQREQTCRRVSEAALRTFPHLCLLRAASSCGVSNFLGLADGFGSSGLSTILLQSV